MKGVTLENDGVVMFPDAPTSRGTKHVLELTKAVQEGYSCSILFVIQMKGGRLFTPNKEMDLAFSDALLRASQQGVQIMVYDCHVKEDELILDQRIPVSLF